MRIDAQAGFVDRTRFRYAWMESAAAHMQREFSPSDLWRILSRNKYEGAIVVAGPGETDWLLETAEREPWIRGVIGEGVEPRWLAHPRFAGVRTTDEVAMHRALQAGIAVDVPVKPGGLGVLPEGRICVVPDGAPDWDPEPWLALGDIPHAMVKICGLINRAGESWRGETYRPFVQAMLERCGPGRLMYGSDWPHCMHTGTWKESLAAFTQAMGAQTMETRSRILGENAARHYLRE